jgi:(4-(4-[2-(gamma-L-glutamylamino)ethyl]phenoxymethyl)furan-2-yl)methanamine synthase
MPRVKPMGRETSWLALDVGGANVKAAHTSGEVRSLPFELWKRPEGLAAALARLVGRFPGFDRVALTMTAELCDCYPTKAEGVRSVLGAVGEAVGERKILVWGLDGRLGSVASTRADPARAAAANWLALAEVAARFEGAGLLVDVGSTTTDLIPLEGGRVAARGRTDTDRLRTGELVYAGVRRTPLCALADRVPFRGQATGIAAEMFAATLDVFLTSGEIPEEPDNLSTADGRPATIEASRDRLARMVGADKEGFTPDDAVRLAESFRERLLARLLEAVGSAGRRRPVMAVVSGSGEFLARELAGRLLAPGGRVVSLSERWGKAGSDAACARALIEIGRGFEGGDGE